MFNWDDKDETEKGFMACNEAVLGLLAQGRTVSESEVEKWLDTSLEGADEHHHIRRHAMQFAMRIIRGPMRSEN